MIKNLLSKKHIAVSLALCLLPSFAFAALRWDAAAFTWAATAIAVDAMTLGTATPIMIAGAAALGLHAGVLVLYWDEVGTAPKNVQSVTVNLDPKTPLVTPKDWKPPETGKTEPTPPDSTTPDTDFTFDSKDIIYRNPDPIIHGASPAEIAAKLDTLLAQPGQRCETTYDPSTSCKTEYNPDTNGFITYWSDKYGVEDPIDWQIQGQVNWPACKDGYVYQSGQCQIVDPAKVMKPSDGRCELVKTDGIIQAAHNDPDCNTAQTYSVVSGIGTSKVTVKSNDNAVEVQSNSGAGVNVRTYNYSTDSGKTTVVETVFDAGGYVQSQSQSIADGDQISSGTLGGSGSTSGSGSGTSSFPSDYARSGESMRGAAVVAASVDALHKDLTDPGNSPGDPSVPAPTDFEDAFFKNTFDGLLSWQLPPHSSECPTAVFDYDLFAHHYHLVMDAQCQIADNIKPTLSPIMVAVYTIAALFIVLGA